MKFFLGLGHSPEGKVTWHLNEHERPSAAHCHAHFNKEQSRDRKRTKSCCIPQLIRAAPVVSVLRDLEEVVPRHKTGLGMLVLV